MQSASIKMTNYKLNYVAAEYSNIYIQHIYERLKKKSPQVLCTQKKKIRSIGRNNRNKLKVQTVGVREQSIKDITIWISIIKTLSNEQFILLSNYILKNEAHNMTRTT